MGTSVTRPKTRAKEDNASHFSTYTSANFSRSLDDRIGYKRPMYCLCFNPCSRLFLVRAFNGRFYRYFLSTFKWDSPFLSFQPAALASLKLS